MKYLNCKMDLKEALVRFLMDQGPTLQAHIGRMLGLPPATLCREIQKLLSAGFIVPVQKDEGKRTSLGLNPKVGFCIGVEYRPEFIRLACVDFAGQVKSCTSQEIHAQSPEELLAEVLNAIRMAKGLDGKLLAVAAIDCGTADIKQGISLTSSLFPGWSNIHVVEHLQSALEVPVHLMFTASARLAAVDRLEFRHRFSDMIFLEYGQGIACGIKCDGHILQGHRGMVGELGHTHVIGDPTPCSCGSVGCLEAVSSLRALGQQAGYEGFQVLIKAKEEDKVAMRLVDKAFEHLGVALGNMINVLNPQALILDPLLNEAGEAALTGLRRTLLRQIMPTHARNLEILVSKQPEPLAPIGGALLAIEEELSSVLV